MLQSIDAFVRYFESVHRRTMRDVAALPDAAVGWRPVMGTGEGAWDVNRLVGHIAATRLYFAHAYRGEGWVSPPEPDVQEWVRWLPALDDSAADLRRMLAGTPPEWLERRVELLDSEGSVSGWRVLLMLVEHEVHHRSQLDTYAGMNGWEPPHIFDRAWEHIQGLQPEQRHKYGWDDRPNGQPGNS